jgi:hypothetical protein
VLGSLNERPIEHRRRRSHHTGAHPAVLPRERRAQAGVTGATVTAMIVRGLVDRDSAARLVLTPDGRAVLKALLGE